MPTVSNYDVLGAVAWGQGRPGADRDRSDARGGINMLLFDNNAGVKVAGGLCEQRFGNAPPPRAPEHAYAATTANACFVSANGYYGYHPQHQDYSMDTTENDLHGVGGAPGPFGRVGQPPSGPGPLPLASLSPPPGQHAWHAAAAQSRKRRPGFMADPDGNDHDAKRSKHGTPAPVHGLENSLLDGPGASILTQAQAQTHSQALAPGFVVQSCTPSIAPAQMYDLPIQQLPGSTSQLADAMTPRPRCLMGHFI